MNYSSRMTFASLVKTRICKVKAERKHKDNGLGGLYLGSKLYELRFPRFTFYMQPPDKAESWNLINDVVRK